VEASVEEQVEEPHRRKEMSEELRKQVYQDLLARSNNEKLGKKDTTIVADQFGLHIRSVQRLWKRGKIQLANSVPVVVSSLKKGKVGRKTIPVDLEALRNIPLKERMTIEDVCAKLNMSKWRVQRYLKKGLIRRHSSSIKPYLTQPNKESRLQWCVDMVNRELLDDPRFKELYDFVFIDEKWFYLHKKSKRYYLLPKKMNPIGLVRIRTTSLGSCSCVFVLGQGLGMGIVFLMVGLVVFHLFNMNRLKEVMRGPAVSVETWL